MTVYWKSCWNLTKKSNQVKITVSTIVFISFSVWKEKNKYIQYNNDIYTGLGIYFYNKTRYNSYQQFYL